jgi:hypothetical protein
MTIPPMLPGLLIAAVGFVTLFVLLGASGALAKSKQLAALRELASGRAGRGARLAFFFAVGAMGVGSCLTFAAVAAGDAKRAQACAATCRERGYQRGVIRGSTAKDANNPKRHAFVACACEGGSAPDPLELEADTIVR